MLVQINRLVDTLFQLNIIIMQVFMYINVLKGTTLD